MPLLGYSTDAHNGSGAKNYSVWQKRVKIEQVKNGLISLDEAKSELIHQGMIRAAEELAEYFRQ